MIIVQTPLRISFFGGGTDFPSFFLNEGGAVLSSAIDKYIFVVIRKRFDNKIRISYTQTELVEDVSEIKHELIREALKLSGITNGVEITTMGDIPAGTGLGSSSAVTVGALHAIRAFQREDVNVEDLAKNACNIEANILGKPVGYQDQYIAAYGGIRFIEFKGDNTISCSKINCDSNLLRKLNENFLLFYTGITRMSDTILTEQKQNIQNRLPILKRMREIAYEARDELTKGNLDAMGEFLNESWRLKKQLASQINTDPIEWAYQAAIRAGATGGKVTGAGGGGCLLVLCPFDKRQAIRTALQHLQELPFQFEADGSKIIFNYRRN